MARIKIKDLPKDMKISKEEMKNVVGGALRVSLQQTMVRTTSVTSFADIADSGLSKEADLLMSAGQTAAPFIPGGAVVSAAISCDAQTTTNGSSGPSGG